METTASVAVHGDTQGGEAGGGRRAGRLLALLLTQELEDGGEVLVAVATRTHDTEDLVGHGAQRDWGARVSGRRLGQA